MSKKASYQHSLAVKIGVAADMLGVTVPIIETLIAGDELTVVLVGAGRRVLTASIEGYLLRQLSEDSLQQLLSDAARLRGLRDEVDRLGVSPRARAGEDHLIEERRPTAA